MALLTSDNSDVLLRLKVVPGSSRDAVGDVLGDRLKIKVAAAPEAGKANVAVCQLLARVLGIKRRDVVIESGMTSPEKTVRLQGVTLAEASVRLGLGPSSPQRSE